ncbi:hypothetical protein [Hymenobacter sp. HDW8]|uniref:hypothetical protein n=1 Tax=Hymenobacter sp. HDW8 TaxID=2714932 RepID=UPI00196B0599|nr:hypothetical protein [Hymenobacter sp. HDW8]
MISPATSSPPQHRPGHDFFPTFPPFFASPMGQKVNHAVFYLEFPATDLPTTKPFDQHAFGWTFQDYGPAYVALEEGPLAGGVYPARGPSAWGRWSCWGPMMWPPLQAPWSTRAG